MRGDQVKLQCNFTQDPGAGNDLRIVPGKCLLGTGCMQPGNAAAFAATPRTQSGGDNVPTVTAFKKRWVIKYVAHPQFPSEGRSLHSAIQVQDHLMQPTTST